MLQNGIITDHNSSTDMHVCLIFV